jgi:hypothetical protein
MQQHTVTLTPPRWENTRRVVSEWVRIAHVRLIGYQEEGPRVIVTVEGVEADVEQFRRIVRLNTRGW